MVNFFYYFFFLVLITNNTVAIAKPDVLTSSNSSTTQSKSIVSTRWQVNINKASAQELAEKLKGIGASKAAAIIAYREEHGNFHTAEDLMKVKGVGAKLFERNQGRIVVE